MPRPLVVFGEDWGRHPSSTQHLIARLVKQRDVIWINSIGLRRPKLSRADLGRAIHKIRHMIARPNKLDVVQVHIPERMSFIFPRVISWPGSRLAAWFNKISLARQIKAELQKRGLFDPIIWTSLPSAIDVIEAFDNAPVIYYCGDDFGALEGVDHAPVLVMERTLAARAVCILAASATLAEQFLAAKTVLMPHGVDLGLFQTSQSRPVDLPDKDKIVGFYGSLSSWIDVETIARTARVMPDWTFVLIGAQRTDISVFHNIKNIVLLGEKPHEELAAYVQHWQVSLLPFKNTPQILACNPLKLREYLAVGKPVVSTYFRAIEPYTGVVEIADYGGDYSAAILRAEEKTVSNAQRRAIVANESWDRRAADINVILETL